MLTRLGAVPLSSASVCGASNFAVHVPGVMTAVAGILSPCVGLEPVRVAMAGCLEVEERATKTKEKAAVSDLAKSISCQAEVCPSGRRTCGFSSFSPWGTMQ